MKQKNNKIRNGREGQNEEGRHRTTNIFDLNMAYYPSLMEVNLVLVPRGLDLPPGMGRS